MSRYQFVQNLVPQGGPGARFSFLPKGFPEISAKFFHVFELIKVLDKIFVYLGELFFTDVPDLHLEDRFLPGHFGAPYSAGNVMGNSFSSSLDIPMSWSSNPG